MLSVEPHLCHLKLLFICSRISQHSMPYRSTDITWKFSTLFRLLEGTIRYRYEFSNFNVALFSRVKILPRFLNYSPYVIGASYSFLFLLTSYFDIIKLTLTRFIYSRTAINWRKTYMNIVSFTHSPMRATAWSREEKQIPNSCFILELICYSWLLWDFRKCIQ